MKYRALDTRLEPRSGDQSPAFRVRPRRRSPAPLPLKIVNGADFQLAFIARDAYQTDLTQLDISSISGDPDGHLIAYRQTAKGNYRILWLDSKPAQRSRAVREFLSVLGEDRKLHPWDVKFTRHKTDVKRVVITKRVQAAWDPEARRKGIDGTVCVVADFGADGVVNNFRLAEGPALWADVARAQRCRTG